MKQVTFTMKVKNKGADDSTVWDETMTRTEAQLDNSQSLQNPKKIAEDIIQFFNDTLKQGEKPRVLVDIINIKHEDVFIAPPVVCPECLDHTSQHELDMFDGECEFCYHYNH